MVFKELSKFPKEKSYDTPVRFHDKIIIRGVTLRAEPDGSLVIEGSLNVTGDFDVDTDLNVDGDAVIDGSLTPGSIVEEAWAALTLENSWVDFGSGNQAAEYRKLANGDVHCRGVVKSGTTTSGTTVFTLPAGYRPPADIHLTLNANNTVATCKVHATGAVHARGGWSATFTSFYLIFSTEA